MLLGLIPQHDLDYQTQQKLAETQQKLADSMLSRLNAVRALCNLPPLPASLSQSTHIPDHSSTSHATIIPSSSTDNKDSLEHKNISSTTQDIKQPQLAASRSDTDWVQVLYLHSSNCVTSYLLIRWHAQDDDPVWWWTPRASTRCLIPAVLSYSFIFTEAGYFLIKKDFLGSSLLAIGGWVGQLSGQVRADWPMLRLFNLFIKLRYPISGRRTISRLLNNSRLLYNSRLLNNSRPIVNY